MLGFVALYSGRFSDMLRSRKTRRSWWMGQLPHEIAALNAR
ncbi:hypothetical protein [uncultured Paracoccus sp.]|nr:hypothetical protein [uncultured Paracoccus sp.]